MSNVELLHSQPDFLEAQTRTVTIDDFLGEITNIETRNGLRNYDLICVASTDSDGNAVVVRKDNSVHSQYPTDWFVVRYDKKTETFKTDVVISPKTTVGEHGDTIELELAPDVSYRGSYTLKFIVNQLYEPSGGPVTLSHKKYYGRGTGVEAESAVDYEYDTPILQESELAEVIDLAQERDKRRQHDIGYSAVSGS